MEDLISSVAAIKAELSQAIEENLLIEHAERTPGAGKRDKLIAQVLSLISHFIQVLRAGGLTAVTARRKLLNIIAIVISLGLDTVGVIVRALTEATFLFERIFGESLDLGAILGVKIEPLESVTDPNSLLFLTLEEIRPAHTDSGIAPAPTPAQQGYSIVDTILMSSRIKGLAQNPLKEAGSSLSTGKKPVLPQERINIVRDTEQAGQLYLPHFLQKKKGRTLH